MNPNLQAEMDRALHRVLGEKDEIASSSGFVASVMDAVRREAAAPKPIPFPWKQVLPGLVVCAGLLAYLLVAWVHGGAAASSVGSGFSSAALGSLLPENWSTSPMAMGMEWSAVALAASLIAVWLTLRLAAVKE